VNELKARQSILEARSKEALSAAARADGAERALAAEREKLLGLEASTGQSMELLRGEVGRLGLERERLRGILRQANLEHLLGASIAGEYGDDGSQQSQDGKDPLVATGSTASVQAAVATAGMVAVGGSGGGGAALAAARSAVRAARSALAASTSKHISLGMALLPPLPPVVTGAGRLLEVSVALGQSSREAAWGTVLGTVVLPAAGDRLEDEGV